MATTRSYQELVALVNARLAGLPKAPTVAQVKAKVMQLPLWPDVMRGVPNGFLRSALFGAIGRGSRRYLTGETIAALDGIDIRYTGQRLDQGDLDVWETVLHIVRLQAMGEQCRFTAFSMLKLLGKTDSGSNRKTLHTRLMRLKANAVEVEQGRYSYAGSLIDDVYRDKETHEYVLILNPKLRALFADDQFTQVDWTVRQALDGKPLAQWLHGYYASHAKPYPVKVETLLKLSGSENDESRSSRQTFRKALDALVEASAANGQPFSYEIRCDLVRVEKTASATQRKHLAKKASHPQKRKI
jgi:TrfA protein